MGNMRLWQLVHGRRVREGCILRHVLSVLHVLRLNTHACLSLLLPTPCFLSLLFLYHYFALIKGSGGVGWEVAIYRLACFQNVGGLLARDFMVSLHCGKRWDRVSFWNKMISAGSDFEVTSCLFYCVESSENLHGVLL